MPQAMDIDRKQERHPFHEPVAAPFEIPARLQVDMIRHPFESEQIREVDHPQKLYKPAKPLRNGCLFCIHHFSAKSR